MREYKIIKAASMIRLPLLILLVTSFSTNNAFPQKIKQDKDIPLSAEQQILIIDRISRIFTEYYPLPKVAKEITGYITKKLKKDEYLQITGIAEFTNQVTKDMRSISKDYHIRISPYEKIPEDLLAEEKLGSADDNFGFHKVEILPANIAYIELTSFNDPSTAGPTAIAAMNFVANSDALIIDLRLNGGGDEDMATFISSYFFDKSTHLTDYYIRKENKTYQVWTLNWVPGKRMTDIPVYILLSDYSYSSAEVLAYALQQLGKAVIIGDTTRGGVHGVKYMSFPELAINMKVPYTQEINPYSKTNYIDGIIPDIPVSSDKAYNTAYLTACRKLLGSEKDTLKRYKLEWALSGCEVDLHPVDLSEASLTDYTGRYQNIQFTIECGKLYIQSSDGVRQELAPMGDDLFKYKEQKESKYRIQFTRDETGKVIEFFWLDSDGDRHPPKLRTNK